MRWENLAFAELSRERLYELLKLRVDVFVVEQACAYPELDGKDTLAETRHLLGLDEQGEIAAYARILAPGVSYPQASIGRVIVAPSARGAGVAKPLMLEAIAIASQAWPAQGIQIGAQEYLKGFYQGVGFRPVSEVYLEDGIPHLDMLLDT